MDECEPDVVLVESATETLEVAAPHGRSDLVGLLGRKGLVGDPVGDEDARVEAGRADAAVRPVDHRAVVERADGLVALWLEGATEPPPWTPELLGEVARRLGRAQAAPLPEVPWLHRGAPYASSTPDAYASGSRRHQYGLPE